MSTNYISSNMTNQEIFRIFKDQIPEFMYEWFENLIDKADDGEAFWGVMYNNNIRLPNDSPTSLNDYLENLVDKHELAVEALDNEIADLYNTVSDLEIQVENLEDEINELKSGV